MISKEINRFALWRMESVEGWKRVTYPGYPTGHRYKWMQPCFALTMSHWRYIMDQDKVAYTSLMLSSKQQTHITCMIPKQSNLLRKEVSYLDCLFFLGSSIAKIWTVPWSLETHSNSESWLKLILQIINETDCSWPNITFVKLKTSHIQIEFKGRINPFSQHSSSLWVLLNMKWVNVNLKFIESLQSVILIFHNIFTHIITFLSSNAAQDRAGRTLVLFGTKPSVPQTVITIY